MSGRGRRRVDISILEPFQRQLSRAWLRRVAICALDGVNPEESYRLGLVIADDDTVRRLNRDYRGLDEVTDVLSFSQFHQGHWEGEGEPPANDAPFVLPPHEATYLGEMIVSYPQARLQASNGHHSLEKELATLIVHGVLHLLGCDHVKPSERASMQAKEREIVSTIIPSGERS